ncbi:Odorant receptor 7a [Culex quinquefasciatus]|uniref:Odorant receptor 7a n=1 Tax=Culex quinquefasciatus TaxID=7176 RepID=B0WW30_CULQU|nr:Odorant receptor 7a [Culex quinquefasciatus]|eukprot:XP_001861602.1 Odorant receptor 7a [Culex quinquefasciatus]
MRSACVVMVQILMLMTVGVNFMMNILLIFMILFGLITEGKVVDCAFSRVFNQALNRQDESSSVPQRTQTFWNELNDRFDECIEQHTQLLQKIALMRNLFESTFLVTYYSTTLHIAGGAFFLISSFKSFDMYMLQMINVVVMQVIECFILSRWTTLLNDVHESIGDTVYDLDWPQQLQHSERFSAQYQAVRAKIKLTIERCNQPLRFSRGGHFEFTQEKFTELMNTAYSLVTFLWDMRP